MTTVELLALAAAGGFGLGMGLVLTTFLVRWLIKLGEEDP